MTSHSMYQKVPQSYASMGQLRLDDLRIMLSYIKFVFCLNSIIGLSNLVKICLNLSTDGDVSEVE